MTGRLLTAREVADRVGYCTETVLRWTREGKLEGVAIRTPTGRLRFYEDRLEGRLEEWATPKRGVLTTTPSAAQPPTVPLTVLTTTENEE